MTWELWLIASDKLARELAAVTPEVLEARRVYFRNWRRAHPQSVKASHARFRKANPDKQRVHSDRAYAEKAALVNETKTRPCVDCNVQYPSYVMDFDHVRGEKLFNVGSQGRRRAKAAIIAEIAKCDVVCANCHREREARRRCARMAA